MFFHIPFYHPSKYLREKKIWIKIRFLLETEKAVLVLCEGRKVWIAKSRIYKIRLRKSVFKVYVNENVIK